MAGRAPPLWVGSGFFYECCLLAQQPPPDRRPPSKGLTSEKYLQQDRFVRGLAGHRAALSYGVKTAAQRQAPYSGHIHVSKEQGIIWV